MEHLPIVGPNGQHIFSFGGACAWKQYTYKDYVVSLEWFGPNGKHVDACMVIWNARKSSHDAGAYIIGRRQITKYANPDNTPTKYAFEEALEALPILGRATLNFEITALVDTIMQHIDDLIKMPVASQRVKQILAGEALFEVEHKDKHTGRVLRESTI